MSVFGAFLDSMTDEDDSRPDSRSERRFFGKYRGTVVNNVDPLGLGRLLAVVPDVGGLIPGTWAVPCLPVAGPQGGMFAVPIIGSGVWVEYEQGDPSRPIWVGCYVGTPLDVPVLSRLTPPGLPSITLQTVLGNGMTINDIAAGPTGGIVIKSSTGASITVNDAGIIIQNGKGASITLMGPTVNINLGALTIT